MSNTLKKTNRSFSPRHNIFLLILPNSPLYSYKHTFRVFPKWLHKNYSLVRSAGSLALPLATNNENKLHRIKSLQRLAILYDAILYKYICMQSIPLVIGTMSVFTAALQAKQRSTHLFSMHGTYLNVSFDVE